MGGRRREDGWYVYVSPPLSIRWFLQLCVQGYLSIRPYQEQVVSFVSLMLDTGFPCFRRNSIEELRSVANWRSFGHSLACRGSNLDVPFTSLPLPPFLYLPSFTSLPLPPSLYLPPFTSLPLPPFLYLPSFTSLPLYTSRGSFRGGGRGGYSPPLDQISPPLADS